MKKMIGLIAFSLVFNSSFSQTSETLQSVTDRGSETTRGIVSAASTVQGANSGFYFADRTNPITWVWYAQNTKARLYNTSSGSDLLTIADNGNLGIGTTAPAYKLDVSGQSYASGGFVAGFPNPEALRMVNNNTYIAGWDNANSVRTGFLQFNTGHSVVLNAENAAFLSFNTGIYERMRIKANGNIGIGTANPMEYKLAVEGVIGARKIKVTQETWADYVLDSSYQLPSLTHVETFIKENKHLPEVPSAADVKKDGLDLGDNQAILLKKIEELTLYIIQQNKKIEHMGKELEEVKAIQRNSGQR